MPEHNEFEHYVFTPRQSNLPHDYFISPHERFRQGVASIVMLLLVAVLAAVIHFLGDS